MNNQTIQTGPTFGGRWTTVKLEILERYLDAYTTALKKQPFDLWYIDAFAGTGLVELPTDEQADVKQFINGSAKRALKIDDKPFDRLIFVEQDSNRCKKLETLKQQYKERDIKVINCDANVYLCGLDRNWRQRRGVLFLDPFATQVKWETLEQIASYKALDMWLLFPVSAISRMLPRNHHPDDIEPKLVSRLNTVFGDESWRNLYHTNPQQDLFKESGVERNRGVEGLCNIYKDKLKHLFGNRFLPNSRTLKNSRNSALFEFLFCAGNPKGAPLAKRIATQILEHL